MVLSDLNAPTGTAGFSCVIGWIAAHIAGSAPLPVMAATLIVSVIVSLMTVLWWIPSSTLGIAVIAAVLLGAIGRFSFANVMRAIRGHRKQGISYDG